MKNKKCLREQIAICFKKIWEKRNPHTVKVLIALFIVFSVLFGSSMFQKYNITKNELNDFNNRALYELIDYNKNVEVLLSKTMITSTPDQSAQILADVWKQASLAKDNLSSLSLPQDVIATTANYYSQTSDYSYNLMRQTINGGKLTKEQYDSLSLLHDYSVKVNEVLMNIYEQSSEKNINWDNIKRKAERDLSNAIPVNTQSFGGLVKTMQDYAGLIYDGAFSNHIKTQKPKDLTDNVVTVSQAKDNMMKYLDESKIDKVEYLGETQGNIITYSFKITYKDMKDNQINIDMTKNDGKILWMVYDRKVENNNVSIEDAKGYAKKYLDNVGFKDMKDTYYTIQDNMMTINFAYVQDTVICYPDLIKVKVALDNGEICGIETEGYLFNHTKRIIQTPKLSITDAKNIISSNIKIENSSMAIIPTEWHDEVLTYEFKGKQGDRSFLIYINANTGIEEKILLIVDSQNGVLTM